LVRQLTKLGTLQQQGMLDFSQMTQSSRTQ